MTYLGQIGSHANPGSAATCVIPVGTAASIGTLVIASVTHNASANPTGFADSKGNTWNQVNGTAASGTAVNTHLAWSVLTTALTTSDTITATFAGGQSRLCGMADAFSDALTATPVDVSLSSASASNTAYSLPATGTLAQASELVYGLFGLGGATAITVGGGLTAGGSIATSIGSNERSLQSGYDFPGATTSITGTGSTSPGTTWSGIVISFKLAPTGGGSASTSDSISVSDSLARSQATQSRGLTDSISVSDVLARSQGTKVRSSSDSVAVADALARSQAPQARGLADNATVSDAVGRSQATKVRGIADTVPVADGVTRQGVMNRGLSDALSVSDNLADTFTPNPAHTFTPPAVPYPFSLDDPIHLGRYMRPKGVSVLKINGTYQTIEYPTQAQVHSATEVYLGGHAYIVTPAVATALVAAGYQVDTPDSVGGTGTGTSPPVGSYSQGGDPGAWDYIPRSYSPVFAPTGTPDLTVPSYQDV